MGHVSNFYYANTFVYKHPTYEMKSKGVKSTFPVKRGTEYSLPDYSLCKVFLTIVRNKTQKRHASGGHS